MKETVFSIDELLTIAMALALTDVDEFGRLEEKVDDLISEMRWQALMGVEN